MGRNDLITGLILAIISILSIGYSLSLPQGLTEHGVIQPGVFPLFISIGLLICSILLMYQGYKQNKKSETKVEKINLREFLKGKIFLFISSIFIYFILTLILGFLISTIITVFMTVYIIFKHRLVSSIVIALTISIGTYIVFQSLLHINLPVGLF